MEKEKTVKPILIKQYDKLALIQDKDAIAAIKDCLDAFMNILHFIKPLYVTPAKKESNFSSDKDNDFYAEFDELYVRLNKSLTPLYNAVRSFLTRKPYSVEKVKLNFENKGLFLNGFVESVTEQSNNGTQYGGYLFRKKNKLYDNKYDYYLGVSNDSHLFSFTKSESIQKDDVSEYERLNYYQLKTNTIYGASYNGEYKKDKSEYIKEILKTIEQLKNPTFYNKIDSFVKDDTTPASLIKAVRNYCMENYLDAKVVLNSEAVKIAEEDIICKIKEALNKCSKRLPKAKEYADKNYSTLIDIQKDIDELVKEKSFEYGPISKSEMETTVKKEEFFLFQISNKDLRYSELRKNYGNDNLHTMYFKQLMSGGQDVYDIGSAEVFYRASSLDTTTVHSAGEEIVNKNPYNSKKTSRFQYAITKDKRYTDRKYLFHLSIIQNNREKKVPERKEKLTKELNDQINTSLKQAPEVNIIGIDRGEKNLAYWSLINSKGEIIKQNSFNTIVNKYKNESYKTNYKDSLTKREKERDEARKSWNSVGKIKELKEGYLSQVVHRIATMMIEHNAIVVFEDLNQGFKRGRMKVERQVYQKLEKMLIDKLNYLVFKNNQADEPGGVRNAYQLTPPFDGYKKMGKQTGAVYYIPAANTSKIDFATGFVNFLYPKYTNEKEAKAFVEKFAHIGYNTSEKYFEFTARYNAFKSEKAEKVNDDKAWVICTQGEERLQYIPSSRQTVSVNVTERMEDLFGKKNILYAQQATDLKAEIVKQEDAAFFKELIFLLKLTLQMRYSKDERDFILSPVADAGGKFFNSEKATGQEPKDADANGAYHIALKGLMLLKRIKGEIQSTSVKSKKGKELDLFISNKDWYEFVWQLKSAKKMQLS